MKKIILFLAIVTLIVPLTGCGSGAGSSSKPIGVNPLLASILQLLPVQYIAQTNSYLTFKAKVLDGNGNVMRNVPVIFTNLSLTGVLSSTVANTDSVGLATVTLFSPTSGFATVQAEVDEAYGQGRDQRTVFFTTATSLYMFPYLFLAVDGDGDDIYNEADDYILFQNTNDNQVLVRATVYTGLGQLVSGDVVTFGSDAPYRIGSDPAAACSDGTTTCGVSFPSGNTATTDAYGQAYVLVQVTPNVLTSFTTVLNITATASNGAFNIVSLFLEPVTVSSLVLTATPNIVESGGTSNLLAAVMASSGMPVPDGTAVNFTATAGALDTPFAQTTAGIATAVLTAPTLTAGAPDLPITVVASAGALSGSTTVTVTSTPITPIALAVFPPTATIDGVGGGSATFTVTGGSPSYTITSADPVKVIVPATVAASGGTFTATVPALTAAGTVLVQVMDSAGASVTVTITIGAAPALIVLPSSATVTGLDNFPPVGVANGGCAGTDGFASDDYAGLITGGTPPYSVLSSSNLNVVPLCAITLSGVNNENIAIDPDSVAVSTAVSIIIIDSSVPLKTATITLTVTP